MDTDLLAPFDPPQDEPAVTLYRRISLLLRDTSTISADSISDSALAARLGVSRTPVREALSRLEAEGMLHKVDGKGWRIAPLTVADIKEILEFEELLYTHAALRAAVRITPQMAEMLGIIVTSMEEAAAVRDISRWLEADRRYDDLLFGAVGNRRIGQMAERLENQWFRLKVRYVVLDWMAVSTGEHRRIAEAIMARNPDLAARSMAAHFARLQESVLHVVRTLLVPYVGDRL